jgi:1,4-alpha-glucan branching enzyme
MLSKKFIKKEGVCEVTFEYDANGAAEVAVVSEGNNWTPVAMTRTKKSGPFRAKLRLPQNGQFQFRYLVDGSHWANDEAADAYITNEFGGANCVVDTTPSRN